MRRPATLGVEDSDDFSEGYNATAGDDLVRPSLTSEAIGIGRTLVDLLPDEPKPAGLLALMLLTEARAPARLAADGSLVRLADQDRTRWDREVIAEGHARVRGCLARNRPELGGAARAYRSRARRRIRRYGGRVLHLRSTRVIDAPGTALGRRLDAPSTEP